MVEIDAPSLPGYRRSRRRGGTDLSHGGLPVPDGLGAGRHSSSAPWCQHAPLTWRTWRSRADRPRVGDAGVSDSVIVSDPVSRFACICPPAAVISRSSWSEGVWHSQVSPIW